MPETLPGPGDELGKTNTQLDYPEFRDVPMLHGKGRVVLVMKGRSSVLGVRHGGREL